MYEYVINLHMHTTYSDGSGTHAEIADAAINAGLDAVIITDHNVLVHGMQGYYCHDDRKVLLLIGEEIHDQTREPQKNHMLVIGADQELATLARDPQELIDEVIQTGGLCFLAHPVDPEAPAFGEGSLSWVCWDIAGYTGIELWNSMTEFKGLLTSKISGLFFAMNFKKIAHGPFPETLSLWQQLLSKSNDPVVAIGGSDAHQMHAHMGILRRILFPYEWHFKAINTHIITTDPFNGDFEHDRILVLEALKKGHCFIGYDLPASTRGFSFSAHTDTGSYCMGDILNSRQSITLQVKLPVPAECHLLKNGERILSTHQRDSMVHVVDEAGIYRVEVYLRYKGKRRGWIFSNPLYIR